MKKKGKVLFQEACDMLKNINSDKSVSQNKVISAKKDKYFEEMQYAIIIGRFYYAFMLIAKGEMAEDGKDGRFEHREVMEYNNETNANVLSAFRRLRELRNDADYEPKFLDLKTKWKSFYQHQYSALTNRYNP